MYKWRQLRNVIITDNSLILCLCSSALRNLLYYWHILPSSIWCWIFIKDYRFHNNITKNIRVDNKRGSCSNCHCSSPNSGSNNNQNRGLNYQMWMNRILQNSISSAYNFEGIEFREKLKKEKSLITMFCIVQHTLEMYNFGK